MSHEPVPHSRRQFLRASLAGLGAMSATRLSHAKSPDTHSRQRKKLIGWGSDVAYPFKVQNNIRKIEELPLDGIVLRNFTGTRGGKEFTFDWECFGKQKYEQKQLADTIQLMKNIRFERFTDNFLRFNVQPGDVDWFDDFSAPLHNARMWSEATAETGIKGWKFDVEDYKEKLFVYRKQNTRTRSPSTNTPTRFACAGGR